MPLKIVTTSYGRAASVALRDELARLKGNEPLAPVTVIVPTNSVGVSARRLLASGALGPVSGDRAGLVGVNFLTIFRLAELLAAGRLAAAGRRPVSTPVVAAAVRQVLAADPGLFRPVSEHPATEEALVDAHRELSDLDDGALDVLASQSLRAAEVVRVHRAVRKLLAANWYDEHDLMRAAVIVIEERTRLFDLGPVVCHLPQRWATPAARVLSALHDRVELVVIAGLTGVAAADAAVVASVERIGGKIDDNERSVPVAVGTEVLDTSDADDEVRAIVRGVVDGMRAGTPLERMAILYGNDEPYARLLHEHLTLAGIVHNGASVRTLADSVLGAALLRLLALPDESFRRDHVFALLTSAPVLDGGRGRVPAVAWERLSRRAGIVGNPDEWQVRLERYAGELGQSEWDERERARAKALGEFVAALVADVDTGRGLHSWSALTRWAHHLIRRWLGAEHRRASWSAFEQEAARRVERALDRLSGLDTVDAGPTVAVFRRTLELELRAARDRVGRIGDGILVGPASLSLGVDLDRLWVCGLAEGVFPAVPHDDPLLGDSERAALDGELRLRRERVDENQRALLAALAATTGSRVCTFPRGDLRRSTEHVPSRFLRATLALPDTRRTTIASFVQGLAREDFAATRHELDVKAALAGQAWVEQQPELARGLALSRARRSDAFTRFDGNLAAVAAELQQRSPTTEGIVVSPTRLEQWASCPHGYFMRYVLHLRQVDRPEEIEQLSPLDRGSLIHAVLDRFLREHIGRRARPWSEADHARLRAIATEEADLLEARGLSGRPLLWQRDRRVILAQLDDFLDADSEYRVEHGAQTLATELQFVDIAVPLTDGRVVKFRGAADRIDVLDDGGFVVIDYKTGSNRDYTGLNADDPVLGGARLQLPIYARAARAAFGDDASRVEAEYWFVGKGDNKTYGYEVDSAVDAALAEALGLIVEGIEGGCFVAVPPAPGPHFFIQCEYCDPDARGTADRWREWERKFSAPELAGFRRLFGGEALEEPDE